MEVSSCPTLPLSWVPNCPVPNCPVSKCPVPSCPVSSCPGFIIFMNFVFNLGRALFHISLHMFQQYRLVETFQLDIVKLMRCFSKYNSITFPVNFILNHMYIKSQSSTIRTGIKQGCHRELYKIKNYFLCT